MMTVLLAYGAWAMPLVVLGWVAILYAGTRWVRYRRRAAR